MPMEAFPKLVHIFRVLLSPTLSVLIPAEMEGCGENGCSFSFAKTVRESTRWKGCVPGGTAHRLHEPNGVWRQAGYTHPHPKPKQILQKTVL